MMDTLQWLSVQHVLFLDGGQPPHTFRIVRRDDGVSQPHASDTIILDPGPGFGSGRHATTRMCLELLGTCISRNFHGKVLDAGTGNGILAIAAARLGAQDVVGVEIDDRAVKTARRNVRLNHVADRVEIRQGDACHLCGPFELIIANLCPRHVMKIGVKMEKLLMRGGHLILSGLSGFETERAVRRFTVLGPLELVGDRWADGWSALLMTKPAHMH